MTPPRLRLLAFTSAAIPSLSTLGPTGAAAGEPTPDQASNAVERLAAQRLAAQRLRTRGLTGKAVTVGIVDSGCDGTPVAGIVAADATTGAEHDGVAPSGAGGATLAINPGGLTMRVLVVDDDPDLSMLMALVLSHQGGHTVDTAGDGVEALERMDEADYDLVVLDWNMPRLDGLGLCAAIRSDRERRHLPLLMVTALPDHARARASGVDQVLGKPFSNRALVEAVDALLGQNA